MWFAIAVWIGIVVCLVCGGIMIALGATALGMLIHVLACCLFAMSFVDLVYSWMERHERKDAIPLVDDREGLR